MDFIHCVIAIRPRRHQRGEYRRQSLPLPFPGDGTGTDERAELVRALLAQAESCNFKFVCLVHLRHIVASYLIDIT